MQKNELEIYSMTINALLRDNDNLNKEYSEKIEEIKRENGVDNQHNIKMNKFYKKQLQSYKKMLKACLERSKKNLCAASLTCSLLGAVLGGFVYHEYEQEKQENLVEETLLNNCKENDDLNGFHIVQHGGIYVINDDSLIYDNFDLGLSHWINSLRDNGYNDDEIFIILSNSGVPKDFLGSLDSNPKSLKNTYKNDYYRIELNQLN